MSLRIRNWFPWPRFLMVPLVLLTARRIAVNGWSMYPCLAPGEKVLFDRLAYWSRPPQRGDVVLADPPQGPGPWIKRVVGLPGETVTIRDGMVAVDGRVLEEPYVEAQGDPSQDGTWKLGPGQYFLLGDNRQASTDSRQVGPLPREAIRARAWLVYWPQERQRRVVHHRYSHR